MISAHNPISKEEAKAIAKAVYKDIHPYIEAHKEEYEAFLADKSKCKKNREVA